MTPRPRRSRVFRASAALVAVAAGCLVFADVQVSTQEPWGELRRIAWGFLTPDFLAWNELAGALAKTLAFAFGGVALGAAGGFGLALGFGYRGVRMGSAAARSVHELFWAIIFLQFLGINAVTGILAIAVPYMGIFAKVYAEFLEEADRTPQKALPAGAGTVSTFFYARLPGVWALVRGYTRYRMECALRSSAVLGFVGLPTLGYHLETFFRQGMYSRAAALLIAFYVLIATSRWWLRPRLFPLYALGALWALWGPVDASWANVARFAGHDIVPYPLRAETHAPGGVLPALGAWVWMLLKDQALPGILSTWLLAQIALVSTGALTLLAFPLASRRFFGRPGRLLGSGVLVVLRSTPEYILAYLFLQLWGPSMLPAIVALSLHNGGILATLTGRHADMLPLRVDAPRGLDLYGYEILPRLYGQFLAFLFYRWEIIQRETAILGMLGVHTLGFYVDSALSELRFDRVLVLIVVTAALNVAVDGFSRWLRRRLRLSGQLGVA